MKYIMSLIIVAFSVNAFALEMLDTKQKYTLEVKHPNLPKSLQEQVDKTNAAAVKVAMTKAVAQLDSSCVDSYTGQSTEVDVVEVSSNMLNRTENEAVFELIVSAICREIGLGMNQ